MRITQTGLLINNPEKATPGVTILAPMSQDTVYLLDMEGNEVHTWDLVGTTGCVAQLLENGNLLSCEESTEICPIPHGRGGFMREYDWDGNLVWEHIDHTQHHDARRLPNGNTLYLGWELISGEAADRVQGGQAGTEAEGGIWCDFLKEVTPAGDCVWEWHLIDEDIGKIPLPPSMDRVEYAHTNACFPLENGDVLVSYQRLSTIAIIDRESRREKWNHTEWLWGRQHDTQMLENGNILLFGNGLQAPKFPGSMVVEFNPETQENDWEYKANRYLEFYSPHISGCQRLPSGNTLICEGVYGRLFEVTPEGEIVWEYICPYESERPEYGQMNWVYRAQRYATDSAQIQNRV